MHSRLPVASWLPHCRLSIHLILVFAPNLIRLSHFDSDPVHNLRASDIRFPCMDVVLSNLNLSSPNHKFLEHISSFYILHYLQIGSFLMQEL